MASSKSMTSVKRRCHAKKDAATDSAAFAKEEQVDSDIDDEPAAKLQQTESSKDDESERSSPIPEPVKPHST